MKHFTFALLAVTSLAVSVSRADTRFSIGVSLGTPTYSSVPPAVVYAPPPVPAYAPPPRVVYAPAPGYWKDVLVKSWVPERWVTTRDRWGRTARHCEPGYYTVRTERVWVAATPGPCAPFSHRENHGRSVPYGYRGY